jgi:hypothetical protein
LATEASSTCNTETNRKWDTQGGDRKMVTDKLVMLVVVRPNSIECQLYSRYPQLDIEHHIKEGARLTKKLFEHPDCYIEVVRYKYVATKMMVEPLNNAVMQALIEHRMPLIALRRIY